jgi:hypothetical protein
MHAHGEKGSQFACGLSFGGPDVEEEGQNHEMHAHKEEEFACGFSFGDPDAEEDQNLFAYDEEFENKMAEKALEMRVVPLESGEKLSALGLSFGIEDEDEIPQKSYAYDIDFETEMAARVIRNEEGTSIDATGCSSTAQKSV